MKKLLLVFLSFAIASAIFAQSDDPCSATALTINTSCVNTSGTNVGATATAGVPLPGCANYNGSDVWYALNPATSGTVIISTTAGSLTDGGMAIYSGPNCASLTLMACDDDNGPGLMPQLIAGVTAGSTYWIRVWEFGGDVQGTFQICAWQYSGSTNQDCVTATHICSTNSFYDNSPSLGAVSDLNATNRGCIVYNEHQSQWYYFQITGGGTLTFTISPTLATNDYDFAVWGPGSSCPPTTAPTRCSSSGSLGNTGLDMTSAELTDGPGWGDKFVRYMDVLPGETYILCIDNFTSNFSGFTFTFGGTATIDCTPVILPIELISFTGNASGSINMLNWETAAETENDLFIIESGNSMQTFSEIGTMNGAGTTTENTEYNFADKNPYFGTTYYRLKEIDAKGNNKYSNIISVENLFTVDFNVFPNPAENGVINIQFHGNENSNARFEIINVYGKIVFEHRAENSISGIQLPAQGIYWVILRTDDTVVSEKVIY